MTGAVLAGGKSRRMGSNKAFIEIEGESIIKRVLKVIKSVFDGTNTGTNTDSNTIIVADGVLLYEGLSTRVVADIFKGAGSLGGVYTALFHSTGGYVFVAACDMPFIDRGCIKKVIKERGGAYDAFIPFVDGRYHPMHALYSKRCMRPIESMIKEGNLRITDLIERIRVKKLTEDDFNGLPIRASVMNINTMEELEGLKKE